MNISLGAGKPIPVLLTDIDDNPFQMRTVYDASALNDLAASIKEVGLLQVPVARKVGKRYQLAFGHRRRKAYEQLYQTEWAGIVAREMPLIVLDLSDREMFEISVSENLERVNLTPIEKAEALKRFMSEFKATSEEAARLFGMRATTVRATVRLLNLPEDAQQQLHAGKMTQTRARKILEKPGTALKRTESKDGTFNLREQLMLLLYDRYRSDVDDELLFKKIQSIMDLNRQLEKQIELMNGRKRERTKPDSTAPRMHEHSRPVLSR